MQISEREGDFIKKTYTFLKISTIVKELNELRELLLGKDAPKVTYWQVERFKLNNGLRNRKKRG